MVCLANKTLVNFVRRAQYIAPLHHIKLKGLFSECPRSRSKKFPNKLASNLKLGENRMLASVNHLEALRLLKIEHQDIRDLIDELTGEEMIRPDTIKYGLYSDQKLSFKDLLAHLICYEVYALEAIDEWSIGAKHPIIEAMADYRESTRIHYSGIAQRAHCSLDEMLEEWESTRLQLEEFLSLITEDEWRAPAPYETDEPTDLGGMLEPILVAPPRPMYRHLPVHIPDSIAYINSLRKA